MSEQWKIGDQGDGRQWWTILTQDGEIVAQAVMRSDAEQIVADHNEVLQAAGRVRALRQALEAMQIQVDALVHYDKNISPMVRATFVKCLEMAALALAAAAPERPAELLARAGVPAEQSGDGGG